MRTFIVCGAAALLLAGCGSGSKADSSNASRFDGDKRDVAGVVDQLVSASRDGDEKLICRELFAPALAAQIGARSGGCEREVGREVVDPNAKYVVGDVRVQGTRAAALVRDRKGAESLLSLVRDGAVWKIARIRNP